jgi:integrase
MIEPQDVAQLLRSIDGYRGTLTVQCALKLAPLLFQRIGELRHMKWDDLDFDRSEWRYLVTKTKTEHIVPLSKQAIEIIKTMQPFSGRGVFVFPGGRTHERPMSENAINAALRNMGYDTQAEITGHGFRAIAQTLGEQELGLDPKHIERQLAHSVANPLGTAYERAQFLKDRKVMMQKWADYLDELKAGAKIIPLGDRVA